MVEDDQEVEAMTPRRPPSKIGLAKPDVRQAQPQIRAVSSTITTTAPVDIDADLAIEPRRAEPRRIEPPPVTTRPLLPPRPPLAGPNAPKNAELRSKIAKLDAELTDLRAAAAQLARSMLDDHTDGYRRSLARSVLALVAPGQEDS
jgi:hypothetical protein